jgi:nicotinamidase-related amidase
MNEKAQWALLLIDLQNDFVDGGALAVPQGTRRHSGCQSIDAEF